jgi:hypothetical protein
MSRQKISAKVLLPIAKASVTRAAEKEETMIQAVKSRPKDNMNPPTSH